MNPTLLALPGVRELSPYQPGKPIAELQRELGLDRIVKLASNENPLGPSRKALEALQQMMDQIALYPDGSGFELKRALSAVLGVNGDRITLGNGSNDVLELVARAFLSPDLNAVFSAHAFAVYPIVTQAIGAVGITAAAHDGTRGPQYGHDLAALAQCIERRTRVVFIANPNNPTGTYLPAGQLRPFLAALPDHVIAVVDEAYVEYVTAGDYQSALPWLSEFPNLIVTRTFSKAYGLAGLRVGFAVSSPQIADLLNRVRQPFNVNALALAAAAAALDDRDHLSKTISLNQRGLEQLSRAFTARGLRFIPSVGNFITVDVERPAAPIFEALLRQGVIVRPVANYGLPHHLRITVGTEQQISQFLSALDRVLRL
jgi:histidinol-phosphate aminotransferase